MENVLSILLHDDWIHIGEYLSDADWLFLAWVWIPVRFMITPEKRNMYARLRIIYTNGSIEQMKFIFANHQDETFSDGLEEYMWQGFLRNPEHVEYFIPKLELEILQSISLVGNDFLGYYEAEKIQRIWINILTHAKFAYRKKLFQQILINDMFDPVVLYSLETFELLCTRPFSNDYVKILKEWETASNFNTMYWIQGIIRKAIEHQSWEVLVFINDHHWPCMFDIEAIASVETRDAIQCIYDLGHEIDEDELDEYIDCDNTNIVDVILGNTDIRPYLTKEDAQRAHPRISDEMLRTLKLWK